MSLDILNSELTPLKPADIKRLKLAKANAAKRGAHKITIANRIHFQQPSATKASELASRNAYRLACGLPPIK